MRMAHLWRCGALAVAISVCLPAAFASTADVQNLIKQGQFAKALEQADSLLVASPKDAQLRFLRGLALTELGRPGDAVEVFQALSTDYPELPEPYNNLAVLYAQQRQYEKARAALEMAIRTHPSYATAHENLGDVYSRLASQAYSKAFQLDANNAAAQTKLALIREMITASAKPGSATVAAARPPAVVAAAPKPAPIAATTPATVTPVPPPPVAVAAPAAASVANAGASAPDDASVEQITSTVRDWAKAWSRKDTNAYLAYYADDFAVPGGRSRAAWEAERRARVGKPGRISVELEDIRVEVDGATATVRFRQNYSSDSFDASAGKSLGLVRQGSQWRIRREVVGG